MSEPAVPPSRAGSIGHGRPGVLLSLLLVAAVAAPSRSADAQPTARQGTERVLYQNVADGTTLVGHLTLPDGDGPFPGVVLLSLAGTDELVGELGAAGLAVLAPERRGMTSIEPLLRATFEDLSGDVTAALDYLRSRPEVGPVALIGQGEDAPPAMLAAAGAPIPLVLLSAAGLEGVETFRLEERTLAESLGDPPARLDELDRAVREIAEVVLSGVSPPSKTFRLRNLLRDTDLELHRASALPPDLEGTIRFLSSASWASRLGFDPAPVLAGLAGPVLVLAGTDDLLTPWELHVPPLREALAEAPTDDVLVCLVEGRVRHSFPTDARALMVSWLWARLPGSGSGAGGSPRAAGQEACLDEEAARLRGPR